jgi:hypothetical protein
LDALADDIRHYGLREAGWLYEGKVLDGRNRAKACAAAGVDFRTREFKGSRLDALAFVWSENVKRRHLNPGQVAVAEAKRAKMHTEYAAEVEKMKAGQPKGGRPRKGEKPPQQVTEVSRTYRETSTRRARAVGTNRR